MELLAHWRRLNAELGGAGLVLPDGMDLAAAEVLHSDLMQKHAQIEHVRNAEELGQGRLEEGRTVLMERMREFCWMLRSYWAGEAVEEALPELPGAGNSADRVLAAGRRVLRLWQRVNEGAAPAGVALPLVLPRGGGCSRADFIALFGEVAAAQSEEDDAATDLEVERAERNALERHLRRTLHLYRVLVPVTMGRQSTWTETLPRLSPLPGHTPDRPVVTAVVADGRLRLAWEPLDEPDLKCWQIRQCRTRKYDIKRERVAATLPADAPRVWETQAAEGESFRVYAVLKTGNERGSKSVVRP